jgi:NitT/TauT family transport system substrate-binding protein
MPMPRFFLLILTALVLGGCRDAPPAPAGRRLEKVTLGLNWFPEAEHGGFYAALVHGDYRAEGLEVEIIGGGPESPILQQVASGERHFGVTNADNILFGRAQQAPVVALMAPLQVSPRCLLVHEQSGITDFAGLEDLTLAMSTSSAFAHYLQHKVPLRGVNIVPYSGNVAQFVLQPRYAQQGYVFSEPLLARRQGARPRVLMLSDLGFNPYTSVLFARAELIRTRPDLVRKLVRASVRGWARYLESPQAANQRIQQLNPEMDHEVLAFGAEQLRPLVLDAVAQERGLGTMTLERWQTLAEQLVECGQLRRGAVDAQQAFTLDFLPAR